MNGRLFTGLRGVLIGLVAVLAVVASVVGVAAPAGAIVGGNYWRTTDDITDTWLSMSKIGFGQNGLEPNAGPGHWNDPDMLVVGKLGWGPKIRPTKLSHNEQITHITLWSMLAAPLLIGCDLTQLDDFTRALLTNPEVLEVSQDSLGRQARRVAHMTPTSPSPKARIAKHEMRRPRNQRWYKSR